MVIKYVCQMGDGSGSIKTRQRATEPLMYVRDFAIFRALRTSSVDFLFHARMRKMKYIRMNLNTQPELM